MKKSKKMWGLLTFTFCLLLALGGSCKHKNDDPKPAPGPNPQPGQKVKVSFRPNMPKMARIKASVDGMESVYNDTLGSIELEVGKTINFEVSDINEDYLPDGWINTTTVSDDKMSATLKVSKNVMVVCKLKKKPDPTVKVTYSIVNELDEQGIAQGLLGVIDVSAGNVTVLSGGEVPVGHSIHITANPNQFNGKHRIKEWRFTSPSMSVPTTQEDVVIEVKKEHVADGINFTVEFEKGEVPKPPLPDGKVRVESGVYFWNNLEEVNYLECGTTWFAMNDEDEAQGNNVVCDKNTKFKYRFDPYAGKELYKWEVTGIQQSDLIMNAADKNKVEFTAPKDVFLKAIVKNQGMSIFSVFIKDENDKYVTEDVAKVVAKYKNDQSELVDCQVSKKYVEAPTGKDVILELMPKDPSYQIESITQLPSTTQVVKDTENLNRFTVKNVQDDIVITIKMKKVETVEITVEGDANVDATSKVKFSIAKETSWKVLKENPNISGVKFTEGYELDKWTEDSAGGVDLADAYKFQANKTIFAKSKIQMHKIEFKVIDNTDFQNPKDVGSDKISIKATKESDATEVQTGASVPYGTKINFVATIHDANWVIKQWNWPAEEDASTQKTDHTKASVTVKGRDVSITINAEEVIELTIKGDEHVEEKSKDVKIKVAKGSAWRQLRWREEISGVKFKEGYKLSKWLKGDNASAPELKDEDEFNAPTTIFAKSKDANLMRFTYKVKDKDWKDMEANLYTAKAVKEGTNEEIANGSDVQKGTKITIEVTFTNPKLKVKYWDPNDVVIDDTNPNKATVTVKENDLNVNMTAYETVKLTVTGDEHLKEESKKVHTVWKDTQWWFIRDGESGYEFFKKSLKFDEGFEADKYLEGSEAGKELEWNAIVDKDMTVYIKTKKKA